MTRARTEAPTDAHAPALISATALYAVAFMMHNADHARRGIAATPEAVVWAGTGVAMLSAVIVTLVLTRHHLAPLAAALGGAFIAVSVSASHLLPDWGPLSDPLPGGHLDAITWSAVTAEVVAAAVLATVGLRVWRQVQSA